MHFGFMHVGYFCVNFDRNAGSLITYQRFQNDPDSLAPLTSQPISVRALRVILETLLIVIELVPAMEK